MTPTDARKLAEEAWAQSLLSCFGLNHHNFALEELARALLALDEENEAGIRINQDLIHQVEITDAAYKDLEAENQRLRTALEFYADENNWAYQSITGNFDGLDSPPRLKITGGPEVYEDKGAKARKALEPQR